MGPPKVLYKTIDGVRSEPIEQLVVDIPEDALGAVMEKMGARKAEMTHMTPQGLVRLPERIPDGHPGRRHHEHHFSRLRTL